MKAPYHHSRCYPRFNAHRTFGVSHSSASTAEDEGDNSQLPKRVTLNLASRNSTTHSAAAQPGPRMPPMSRSDYSSFHEGAVVGIHVEQYNSYGTFSLRHGTRPKLLELYNLAGGHCLHFTRQANKRNLSGFSLNTSLTSLQPSTCLFGASTLTLPPSRRSRKQVSPQL